MGYFAQYTILIDGATWGRYDYVIDDAETDEEAIQQAREFEESYVKHYGEHVEEILLDHLYNEDGEEVDYYDTRGV